MILKTGAKVASRGKSFGRFGRIKIENEDSSRSFVKPKIIVTFEKLNSKKMTYQIQISPSKQGEFLQIIESLQKLGVIKNFFRSESFVTPGEPAPIDQVLETLAESEKQIEEGLSFTTAEAKIFLKSWQQRKR